MLVRRVLAALGLAATTATSAPARAEEPRRDDGLRAKASGWIELYAAWNANRPSSGITNYRAFDNRSGSLTLSNAVVAVDATGYGVRTRVALQAGATADSYTASEPSRPGADGAGRAGQDVTKHVQEAWVAVAMPFERRLEVDAGVFLSPVGPESMAIKDTWLWSRSNLFYGLPFYHTGARLRLHASSRTTLEGGLVNGWNSVVDNNADKSLWMRVTYDLGSRTRFALTYLGGAERGDDAPEGQPVRSLFDATLVTALDDATELALETDAGFERNRLGTSGWSAGQLIARRRLASFLWLAARGDVFLEKRAVRGGVAASPIFWPSPFMASAAVAADARPHPNVSFRLEGRHDAAGGPTFHRGEVPGDGTAASPYVANARTQTTLTLGVTAWF